MTMIHYYIPGENGEVIGSGTCQGDAFEQIKSIKPEAVIGHAEFGVHFISDDGIVHRIPDRPSPLHKFCYQEKQWKPSGDLAASDVKVKRGKLLSASDWTQLPDVPLATKAAWATYRQALRDITQQPGYPMDVSWPTPPA